MNPWTLRIVPVLVALLLIAGSASAQDSSEQERKSLLAKYTPAGADRLAWGWRAFPLDGWDFWAQLARNKPSAARAAPLPPVTRVTASC